MSDTYIPCRIAQLPSHLRLAAAREAVRLNPANGPPPSLLANLLVPEQIAAITGKCWPASGVRLTVQFLDNPDQATRRKILAHANAWGQSANVQFTETTGHGQVRVSRASSYGYSSYLGTDNLLVPAGEPTMYLADFDAGTTPDSEFFRVVRHEFGHALAMIHEHTRQEIVEDIDPPKALALFMRTQGWSAQTVREQVLTPANDALLTELPAEVRSIMCYGLPASIMKDGVAVPGGTDITAEDYALAARLYPKAGTGGGGNGNGGQPPSPPTRVLRLTFAQAVAAGRRVQFQAPRPIPAGAYDLVPAAQGVLPAAAAQLLTPYTAAAE